MSKADSKKAKLERAYDLYADRLYRIALTQLGNDADAQDAVHDVFTKFFTTDIVFLNNEHERAWFIRVLLNRCRDMIRRGKLRTHTDIDDAHDIAAEEKDDHSELIAAVHSLPDKYRTVIILHYLEDIAVEEIAAALSLSVSAVKMRLMRGREMLKTELERNNL